MCCQSHIPSYMCLWSFGSTYSSLHILDPRSSSLSLYGAPFLYCIYHNINAYKYTMWGKMSCDQHLTCVMQQQCMHARSDINDDGGSRWQGGRMVSLDQRCPPPSTVHQLMQSAYASLHSLLISLVVHHQGYLIW